MSAESLKMELLCGQEPYYFDHSNNEILILHSSSSTGVEITCNDGAIVGHQ